MCVVPFCERLQNLVLITHGVEDAVVLMRMGQHNAEKIKHAQTSYYPNVGHAPFWEDADHH